MGGRGSSSGGTSGKYASASTITDAKELGKNLGGVGKEVPLTKGEADSLLSYVANGYTDMNGLLRGDYSSKDFYPNDLAKIKKNIENVSNVINNHKITQNIVVGRGMDSDVLTAWGVTKSNIGSLVGKTIQDKGFMSTSLVTDKTAPHFGGSVMLEIKAKKGSKASYLSTRGLQAEQEVLFDRGTKMKVKSAKVLDNGRVKIEVDIV